MNVKEAAIFDVMAHAASAWNINPLSITDRYRGEEWVWARAFAAYFMRYRLRLKWREISEALKRDHATCIPLANKVADSLRYDKQIAKHYELFETLLTL